MKTNGHKLAKYSPQIEMKVPNCDREAWKSHANQVMGEKSELIL